MKLFDTFEAVKFPEEDMIFITRGGYLYYIYNPKYKWWRKHSNAGNDHLTVSNYPDVSRDELVTAMKGLFPQKETDFMRMCNPSQLCIRDMLDLLKEDHPKYMADYALYHTIHRFLLESDICHKSFEKIQTLLSDATANRYDSSRVLTQINKQIIVIEIIFVLMFLTRMQIYSCKSLCTEQACACSVSYSAKESALRNSLGNSSFDLLHQCRKDALNDGEHIRLATIGSHIQTAVYLNHNGANICVTVQMLHRYHRP